MQQYWWMDSDNVVYLSNLRNRITGSYYNDLETITAQLYDTGDTKVGDAISGSYVATSNGCYTLQLPDDIGMTANTSYYLKITIIAGSLKLTRIIYRTASYKGEQGD